MNLILDMDGTLIDNYWCIKTYRQNIVPRPYLKDFFEFIFQHFERVSIWTNAFQDWYDEVYEKVFRYYIPEGKSFHFVRTREDLYHIRRFVKPLSEIYEKYPEYNSYNTLIIDDIPKTYSLNLENAIPILPYLYLHMDNDENNENIGIYNINYDDELLKIIHFFRILLFVPYQFE